MITVCYFAGIRDITGKSEERVERESCSVRELKDWAAAAYPDLVNYAVLIAVNEEYAHEDDLIQSGDVVAFIPPVSGG